MDWKNIPSLASLRAFEAAARHQNQSKAAAELNVTHAAINQHIRNLERELALPLIRREWRGMALTDEGQKLYAGLSRGFSQIALAIVELQNREDNKKVRISLPASIYERWLIYCVEDFWNQYPDIELSFHSSPKLVDLVDDGFDLALRHGWGEWPPYQSQLLLPASLSVFGASQYINAHPEIQTNLGSANWVSAADSPELDEQYRKMSVEFDCEKNRRFELNSEARAAMIAGVGLSIQDTRFLRHEIEYGLVEEVKPIKLDERLGYYLVYREGAMKASTRVFMRWLISCVSSLTPQRNYSD